MIERVAITFTFLLVCGCVDTGTVRYRFFIPQDQGQLADVKTVPGHYAGYDVLGLCEPVAWTQHRIMIRGQGSRRLVRPTAAGWGDEMLALRLRAEEALGSAAQAVWYEDSACHRDDWALTAFVTRYDQVDAVIERLGRLLRDEDLGDHADVVVLGSESHGPLTRDTKWRMPLARRPFFPYEISLSAGPRYQDGWNTAMALHLGLVWGREGEPPSKAGWFWGLGLEGRIAPVTGERRWSVGPGVRLGRAFGALQPDRPAPGANRGTYVYAEGATEWSADGPVVVMSLGFTTLAVAEWVLTRYNSTGNNAYPLLLPLGLLNHVAVGWELDTTGARPPAFAILVGFSL